MYIKKCVLLRMLAICWMWYVFISLPAQLTLNAAQNLNFVINNKYMTQVKMCNLTGNADSITFPGMLALKGLWTWNVFAINILIWLVLNTVHL